MELLQKKKTVWFSSIMAENDVQCLKIQKNFGKNVIALEFLSSHFSELDSVQIELMPIYFISTGSTKLKGGPKLTLFRLLMSNVMLKKRQKMLI